jgi:hypothetical protein
VGGDEDYLHQGQGGVCDAEDNCFSHQFVHRSGGGGVSGGLLVGCETDFVGGYLFPDRVGVETTDFVIMCECRCPMLSSCRSAE